MARPRKPINYEEELIRIESQITKYENTLKEIKKENNL